VLSFSKHGEKTDFSDAFLTNRQNQLSAQSPLATENLTTKPSSPALIAAAEDPASPPAKLVTLLLFMALLFWTGKTPNFGV
jgi:hypothetical protein